MKHRLLLSFILPIAISCTNQEKDKSGETSEKELSSQNVVAETITATDSAFINASIQQLKGIERYAVGSNFFLLSSLLVFKGDSIQQKKIDDILKKKFGSVTAYSIDVVDVVNGYMRYAPVGAEVTYTTTYWNLPDGSSLIATEDWGCGPICSSGIRFWKFMDGRYQNLESLLIIPEIDRLPQMLVPDYKEGGDPVEFRFVLPQKGQNIKYCLDDKCIELRWKNGVFSTGR